MSHEYLLGIIKFIYQTKNKRLDLESMEYFNFGTHFPQFVSLLLEQIIPNLISNPNYTTEYLRNFKATILFLKNQGISVRSYKALPRSDQKEEIILNVITNTIFKMDAKSVFNKARTIFENNDLINRYKSPKDIFNSEFLLTLLHAVTKGEVEIPKRDDDKTEMDKLIEQHFQNLNIPLVIDNNSFDIDNPQRFLIQVQIIFMIFSKEIDEVESKTPFYLQSQMPNNKIIKTPLILLAQPKPLKEVNSSNNLNNASSSSFQNFIDEDYSKTEIHLNIVNSLIKDPTQRIKEFGLLFKNEGLNKLFSIVQNFLDENINLGNGDIYNKIQTMKNFLGERFSKHKKFFTKIFNINSTEKQNDFIKELISCYFEKDDGKNFNFIKDFCKAIFYDYQIDFKDFDQFYELNGSLFLPLLQRLAFKKIKDYDIFNYPPKSDLTLQELHDYFKQLDIPFIFVENTFQNQSNIESILYFQYQVKLILDQFDKDYLNSIVNDYNKYSKENVPLLLKTINAIGARKGIHFNKFESVIDGSLLPILIECFLQKPLNKQVQIIKKTQLTEEESDKNIDTIIEFLKSEKSKFKMLLFNFKDPEMKISSAKTLCKNLANLFFLKKSGRELLDRCDTILSTKIRIKSVQDFEKGMPFSAILHFLMNCNIHFQYEIFRYRSFDRLKEDFQKVRIPMVIDETCLENPSSKESFIFYQLQFIFDKLDSELYKKKPSIVVTEVFLKAAKKLLKFEKICTRFIKDSAVAKHNSPNLITERNIFISTDKKEELKSFESVLNDLRKDKKEVENQKMNLLESNIKNDENMLLNWNPGDRFFITQYKYVGIEKHLFYKNGSLNFARSTDDVPSEFINYSTNLKDDLDKYFKIDKQSKKGNKPNINKHEKQEKLYKIFIYNPNLHIWEFNLNDFKNFIKDKNLAEHKNINLVSFINSHEDDIKSFNSIYLNDDYPNLDDDQLFVYALCHNYSSSSVPIYLLLHVPQKKIKDDEYNKYFADIASAIIKIYSYLYSISDIKIVLMNLESSSKEKNIYHQIETTKIIDNISKSISLKYNTNSKLILLANRTVSKYDSKCCENMERSGVFRKFLISNKFPKAKTIPASFEFTNSECDFVFKDIINEMTKNICSTCEDICIRLQSYPQHQISGAYILLKSQLPQNIDKCIKGFIKFRLDFYNRYLIKSKAKMSETDIMLVILDEFAFFTPQNDIEFNQKYRTEFYDYFKKTPNMESEISDKLKSTSRKLINVLNKIILTKLYWENQQIAIIKNSYFSLLDEAFYNIIFICKFGRIADIIYKDLHNILDNQRMEDQKTIEGYFEVYINKIKDRNNVVTKDLKNDIIKSTKYVMKETENLKDREVLVGAGQKLEKVIEQDF